MSKNYIILRLQSGCESFFEICVVVSDRIHYIVFLVTVQCR